MEKRKKQILRKGLNQLQKPWTKILLVVNVGSLEKRSNQPKYREQKHEKSKDYCKADLKQRILFFITIFLQEKLNMKRFLHQMETARGKKSPRWSSHIRPSVIQSDALTIELSTGTRWRARVKCGSLTQELHHPVTQSNQDNHV